MTKEEFIDKIGIANQTISKISSVLEKIKETKNEAISVFLNINSKFAPGSRVKVGIQSENGFELIGYGFIAGAIVEEDYGIIFYPVVKEDPKTKMPTTESFDVSKAGVHENDAKFCDLIIKDI